MVIFVILLSLLMMLLSIACIIRRLICGINQSWLLNLNLTYKVLWIRRGCGSLISILKNSQNFPFLINLFCPRIFHLCRVQIELIQAWFLHRTMSLNRMFLLHDSFSQKDQVKKKKKKYDAIYVGLHYIGLYFPSLPSLI